MVITIDFETRSAIDLKARGADVYSKDPSTAPWCLGYAIDEGQVEMWKLGDENPEELFSHIKAGATVVAHNAPFEISIWNNCCNVYMDWPLLDASQVECTMAMAYSMSLPGSLEKAAPAAGIEKQKDMAGNRVMLQLAQPRSVNPDGSIVWWTPSTAPEKFEKLYEYCIRDVEVERELYKRLKRLSVKEREVWLLDQKINDRGIKVDVAAVKKALAIVDFEKARLDNEMRAATKGAVATCTATKQITDWVKDQGVELDGIAKADIVDLLGVPDLPDHVRAVLLLRQEAAKSSTAKLKAMIDRAGPDDRIRGMFQYHGAGTGRWAGRGVQLQNLPRSKTSQAHIEDVFKNLDSEYINTFYGPPMSVLSDCIRGFLVPKEWHEFLCCDFSAIEARCLPWLAGEERVLEIFRTHGKIYEHAAAGIYGVPMEQVTKDQRQIGKVAILALGYQGGKGAFKSMASAYGVTVGDEQAEGIKTAWRASNPNIVKYWYEVERAATNAVLNPGATYAAGPKTNQVKYKTAGSFLWCQLPSKRNLCYPYPEIQKHETPWGQEKDMLTYMGEDSFTRKWSRMKAYGGMLVENITQAVARDLLVDAMISLENAGYSIVAHVHDEILCEVETNRGTVKEMETIMSEVPAWASGMSIAAEGWQGIRYRK